MSDNKEPISISAHLDQRLKGIDEAIHRLEKSDTSHGWQQIVDWAIKNLVIMTALGGGIGTVVIGLWGGLSLYDQSQKLIERTDSRIAALVGTTRPNSAEVYGLSGQDDRTIRYIVNLEPYDMLDQVYYRVFAEARLRVRIEGEPGLISGYYAFIEGSMLDELSVDFEGQPSEVAKLQFGTPFGETFSESEAEIITERSTGNMEVRFSVPLRSCEQALKIVERLVSSNSDIAGVTWVLPVIKYIGESPSFKPFENEFSRGAIFDCYSESGDRIVESRNNNHTDGVYSDNPSVSSPVDN